MVLRDSTHYLFTHCTNYLPPKLEREEQYLHFIVSFWRPPILNYHLIEYGGMIARIWTLILTGHRSGQILEKPPATLTANRSTLTMYTEHIWPLASLCSMKASGTFLHMMLNCRPVSQFWTKVTAELSDMVSVTIPVTIPVLLLIDLSEVNITKLKKLIVLAGRTAAKKLIALRWKPPHSLTIRHWALTFLDVIYLELSTARINGTP